MGDAAAVIAYELPQLMVIVAWAETWKKSPG